MAFEMRYPVGGTTNVFQPGKDFTIGHSGQERVDQRIGQAVDVVLYSYQVGSASYWRYTRSFSFFSQADMAALEDFLDAVGGDPFEFKDGVCGPVTDWQAVKLDPESYRREYTYAKGQRQEVELVLREEVA